MGLISFFLQVVVALVIGSVANKLSPWKMPGSWVGAIVVGFLGSWFGPYLFGIWGPMIVGFSLIPSLIGSLIIVLVVGFIYKKFD